MNIQAIDRALTIHETIADRAEPAVVRAKLAKHLMAKMIAGETDDYRLTMHGLSYLRAVDRERDS